MRRSDREIKDIDEIKVVLENTKIFHLALFDEEYPYIVSLHYGYELIDEKLFLYAHYAKQGHKLDCIDKNNKVCIEIDNDVSLVSGYDIACRYGSLYSSIIARGTIEKIKDTNTKKHALKVLMKHQTGKDFEFNDKMVEPVEVLCFKSDSFTAKARKK